MKLITFGASVVIHVLNAQPKVAWIKNMKITRTEEMKDHQDLKESVDKDQANKSEKDNNTKTTLTEETKDLPNESLDQNQYKLKIVLLFKKSQEVT